MTQTQPEIEFPVDWTYRILCDNSPEVRSSLNAMLDSLGIGEMKEGNVSRTGKYVTFKVKRTVYSMDELHDLPKRLNVIPGIKQIL